MSLIREDLRPASLAVKDAANTLLVRWTTGGLGTGDDRDAILLMRLNALDQIADELAAIEEEQACWSAPVAVPAPVAAQLAARPQVQWGARLLLARVAAWAAIVVARG